MASGADRSQAGESCPATRAAAVAGDWMVYMVRCADGSLYTGIAKDLRARVKQHNLGTGARYTRSRRPVELVFSEPAADRGAALRREAAIKRLGRKSKQVLAADPGTGAGSASTKRD